MRTIDPVALREEIVSAFDLEQHYGPREINALFAAAARLSAPSSEPHGWRDIASAPYHATVEVRVGGMTFGAVLEPDAAMTDDEQSCDQWRASVEGEHPPCWSDGECWTSNVDGNVSLQPSAWRFPAAPTTTQVAS